MKSHLVLYTSSERDNPIIYQHEFYIAGLIDAGKTPPYELDAVNNQYGDILYTRKEHGTGLKNALRIGGEVLLITGAIAVEVILSAETE